MVGVNMVLAEFIEFVSYSYLRACRGYYARTMFTPTMFSRGRGSDTVLISVDGSEIWNLKSMDLRSMDLTPCWFQSMDLRSEIWNQWIWNQWIRNLKSMDLKSMDLKSMDLESEINWIWIFASWNQRIWHLVGGFSSLFWGWCWRAPPQRIFIPFKSLRQHLCISPLQTILVFFGGRRTCCLTQLFFKHDEQRSKLWWSVMRRKTHKTNEAVSDRWR